jgi:hypothetical protein
MATLTTHQATVLGLRVLTAMHQRHLSQRALARQAGLGLAIVQRIVAGKGK